MEKEKNIKTFRIGNEIQIKWPILTNGEETSLDGRRLSLYLSDQWGNDRKVEKFGTEGNVIVFTFLASEQYKTGVYRLTLFENEGLEHQTACDYCYAFRLVAHSCDIPTDMKDGDLPLDSTVMDVGIHGLSAYEIAVNYGYEGSEEQWAKDFNTVLSSTNIAVETMEKAQEVLGQAEDLFNELKDLQATEQERKDNEKTRIEAEKERQANETKRNAAESTRQDNEKQRIEAENKREQSFASDNALREQTFNNLLTEQQNSFLQHIREQEQTFSNTQTERQETFEKSEKERSDTANTSEKQRQEAFDNAEAIRQQSFETNENNREKSFKDFAAQAESAEKDRAAAEKTREENERQRKTDEKSRVEQELSRREAENARRSSEQEREAAENRRRDNEQLRERAETLRLQTDTFIKEAETVRAEAERRRTENETERIAAEEKRNNEEKKRADAEIERVKQMTQAINNIDGQIKAKHEEYKKTIDNAVSEAASAVSAAIADWNRTKIVIQTETEVTIAPNVKNVWETPVSKLCISFTEGDNKYDNEYMMQFSCPADVGTELSFPDDVRWIDDDPPQPQAGKTYQISISDNLAIYAEWEAANK